MTRSKSESSINELKIIRTNENPRAQELQRKFRNFKNNFQNYFQQYTGHNLENFNSLESFIEWMHQPTDAASLGVFRSLFGLLMLIDIAEERGGSSLDVRFGEPKNCHFPLFDFIQPTSLPVMGIIYLIMWLGALGITLGYKFKIACLMFIVPYWYIFWLDITAWNNHSYLYGLCGFLLIFTDANRFCSLDYLKMKREQQVVPFWNYFLIKYQFFILYFIAGLKKLSIEWLSGYSMTNLGYHWVFTPLRIIFSVEMIELIMIHYFAAIFDFSITFFMTYEKTRWPAIPFMLSFHLMNTRLFTIGMFPWVCVAEIPMYFKTNWPRTVWNKFIIHNFAINEKKENIENSSKEIIDDVILTNKTGQEIRLRRKRSTTNEDKKSLEITSKNSSSTESTNNNSSRKKIRIICIFFYCCLQLFLPYSHFLTKGYNNWTNGLYGYSWDMMVYSYDTILTSVKIVDNKNHEIHYLEPFAFSESNRWTKHAKMAIQYGKCIERNLLNDFQRNPNSVLTSSNISIYFDSWCSMNGRFQQRFFNPNIDILKAQWSPFKETEWIFPLLDEFNFMRPKLNKIANNVLSWSNFSDVLFVADFPDMIMDNFIAPELDNITLTVLDGVIYFEIENKTKYSQTLNAGQSLRLPGGQIHKIKTISKLPSCYMYTFINKTMLDMNIEVKPKNYSNHSILPLWNETVERLNNFRNFFYQIGNSLLFLTYGVPMPIRIRERD